MSEETTTTQNSAGSIIGATLLLAIGYAVLRYHIAGPVPWEDLSFFILNKGLCLAAFVMLTMNFALGPLNNLGVAVPVGWLNARKALGMTGFLLVLIHVLMSVLLFNSSVYGKFFQQDGTLTLLAGLSMLTGVLAFVLTQAVCDQPQVGFKLTNFFIGKHIVVVGRLQPCLNEPQEYAIGHLAVARGHRMICDLKNATILIDLRDDFVAYGHSIARLAQLCR